MLFRSEEIKKIVNEVVDKASKKYTKNNPITFNNPHTRIHLKAKKKEEQPEDEEKPEHIKGVKKAIKKQKHTIIKKKTEHKHADEERKEGGDENPEDESNIEDIADIEESGEDKSAVDNEEALKDLPSKVAISFLYKPLIPLPNLTPYLQGIIEIRIAKEYLCKSNKAYRLRRIWGNDTYTSDTDIVCALQHTSLFTIENDPPEAIAGISVYCRVVKSRNTYQGTFRNGIRSKKSGPFEVRSIRLESI